MWEVARGQGSGLEAVGGRWGQPPPRQTPTLPPMPPRLSKNPLMLISSQAYRLPSTATLLLKQWSVPTLKTYGSPSVLAMVPQPYRSREREIFCAYPARVPKSLLFFFWYLNGDACTELGEDIIVKRYERRRHSEGTRRWPV